MAKKQTAWQKHLDTVYNKLKRVNPKTTLGDAMKEAKKTYKK